MPITRYLTGLAAGLAAFAATAGPAAAHVTVNPQSAAKGSYAELSFRVPNERPTSGTVKVEVVLPTDRPIQSVSVRPHPAWKVTVDKTKLASPIPREGGDPVTEVVSKITWTGGTINPGEFDEFEVSAGPVPKDVDQLVFKSIQTYASGEIVSWIEEPVPGGSEPERPAPVLKLTSAPATGGTAEALAGPAATPAAATTDAPTDDDLKSVRTLAIGGLLLGGLGLVAGAAALLRRRSPPGDPGPA